MRVGLCSNAETDTKTDNGMSYSAMLKNEGVYQNLNGGPSDKIFFIVLSRDGSLHKDGSKSVCLFYNSAINMLEPVTPSWNQSEYRFVKTNKRLCFELKDA